MFIGLLKCEGWYIRSVRDLLLVKFYFEFIFLENLLKICWKKNGKKFGAGHLEVISLADLRNRVTSISPSEKNSFFHMHQAGDVECPMSPDQGQTRDNQINCLAPILNRLLIGSSKPFKWTFDAPGSCLLERPLSFRNFWNALKTPWNTLKTTFKHP